MSSQPRPKTISLEPSWKNHLIGYAVSILLIPVLGIGLVTFYWVRKRHKKYSYEFSDVQIRSQDQKYQRNIDLVNIEKVEVRQRWLQQKMGVGDILLFTSASSMSLRGLENPYDLKNILEQAISAEKKRLRKKQQSKPRDPEFGPGTMDKMDYLTGLWQQGLVSDEDYEKEKKHFE